MTIDYAKARAAMVEQQVRPWDVLDPRVLETISRLPREAFVADARRALAYADLELPLGHGETMLKPVVEGRALQALKLEQGEKNVNPITPEELETVEMTTDIRGARLGCQLKILGDITVRAI